METREGVDIYELIGAILAFMAGIVSGLMLREWLEKRKKKRGGRKRQGKKS